MLIIKNIPEPQRNENSIHLFNELNGLTPIYDPSRLWEFLASGSKCYLQESVYNMFLTWELRTNPVPDIAPYSMTSDI